MIAEPVNPKACGCCVPSSTATKSVVDRVANASVEPQHRIEIDHPIAAPLERAAGRTGCCCG